MIIYFSYLIVFFGKYIYNKYGDKMKKHIKDYDINYVQYGNESGKEIVLLHGWGQNIQMMDPIGQGLKDKYHITIIDLPGFGESSEPSSAISLYDYYECVDELLNELKVKNPTIVGHSFGGRIGIIYASEKRSKKLVLLSSPFIKRIKKPSMKVKVLKSLKKVPGLKKLENFAKKHIGSTDYKNASEVMRKILVNTVNEDLTDYVKSIHASTIVVAGEVDYDVPLEEIELYEKYIDDCAIIVYPNCTHYAYLEDINRTIGIIRNFV